MQSRQQTGTSVEDRFRQTLEVLDHLLKQVGHQEVDFHILDRLLQGLPLSSGEFSLASNRLRNAAGYLVSSEIGAAKWELTALRNQIESSACSGGMRFVRRGRQNLFRLNC